MRLRRVQLLEVPKHLDREGFATVGDVFPTLDLVDDPLNYGCEGFVGLLELARIPRVGTSTEFSDATNVFLDSSSFDGAARNGVSGGQMDGIQGELPIAPLNGEVFERHVAVEFHIQTKDEPVDTVGSKCPKFFGSFGGAAQCPENSIDSRSDVNS